MQIETILFRASALLEGDKHLVLKAEGGVHPIEVPYLKGLGTRKLSSTAGYKVFVARDAEDGKPSQTSLIQTAQRQPQPPAVPDMHGFAMPFK